MDFGSLPLWEHLDTEHALPYFTHLFDFVNSIIRTYVLGVLFNLLS